jgi:excisionase family DNA binding protein
MLELLTPRDAGKILGVTTLGVIYHANEGHLKAIRDSGNRRLFRKSDVIRFKEERDAKRARRAKEVAAIAK